MTTEEIVEEMRELFETLAAEDGKTTKVSMNRARAAANSIKKLSAEYKRTSLAEQKAL